MAQSLAKVLVHIVFSTKKRDNLLSNELQHRVYPYIRACLKNQDCFVHALDGTENHIHILCELPKTKPICKIIEIIKTSSSMAIKKMAPNINGFHWQNGYGIFSVSQSNLEVVVNYICHQKEHHKKISFEDELRLLLQKNKIVYDETYLWD